MSLKPDSADKLASDIVNEVLETLLPDQEIDAGDLSRAAARVEDMVRVDRKTAASWFRSNIRLLFKALGAKEGTCRRCPKKVWFVPLRTGKAPPYTQDGLNHFADCPHAKSFRKGS